MIQPIKTSDDSDSTKGYVCIFVCEDTRAVHFELTNDMTTEELLQAYRRMANRRGTISGTIHSDNQTTFHKGSKVFKTSSYKLRGGGKIDPKAVEEKLANEGVTWTFITPRASHRGGRFQEVLHLKWAISSFALAVSSPHIFPYVQLTTFRNIHQKYYVKTSVQIHAECKHSLQHSCFH